MGRWERWTGQTQREESFNTARAKAERLITVLQEVGRKSLILRRDWDSRSRPEDDLAAMYAAAQRLERQMRSALEECAFEVNAAYPGSLQETKLADRMQRLTAQVQAALDDVYTAFSALSTKECPDCAETIKRDARVCRYCGFAITTDR